MNHPIYLSPVIYREISSTILTNVVQNGSKLVKDKLTYGRRLKYGYHVDKLIPSVRDSQTNAVW